MITRLDDAVHKAADPPSASTLQLVTVSRTGRRGRPRKEINQDLLAQALQLSSKSTIARHAKVSARTVQRRALEYGLAQPGQAVFVRSGPDGTMVRQTHSQQAPQISDIELDAHIADILATFPSHGRALINGQLRSLGIRVTRQRIRNSYERVHGPPPPFGRRVVPRRTYDVPGANSLWHHDGQHGQ
jgi:hypothetical protein